MLSGEKDARYRQLEKDLEDLQYRFEDQTTEKRALIVQIDEFETKLTLAQQSREAREFAISALKEEKRRLERELETARGLASTSNVQEVVNVLEIMKENEELKDRLKSLDKERRLAVSIKDDLQQSYLAASEHASTLSNQVSDKESQIVGLTRRASGIAIEVKRMNHEASVKTYTAEIQRLKAMLANREQLLKTKEEELKSRRVPIGTRASSVPRSPRVGPTSRAGSPISDKRINNLKNNHNL